MKCGNRDCKHEKRFHAEPDKHNLGTNHCTASTKDPVYCKCKGWEEPKEKENKKKKKEQRKTGDEEE